MKIRPPSASSRERGFSRDSGSAGPSVAQLATPMNRFSRHGLIPGFDQQRLLDASILVVGAGAIGNEVLKNLALMGFGAVHIIDPDSIEETNLCRSVLFDERDVGRPKAEVAAEACRRLFPSGRFSWSQETFWRWASLARLRRFTAVIAATDGFESRLQINQLCRLAPVDFINAAVDARHACVEAFPFRADPASACYGCSLPRTVLGDISARRSCAGLRRAALNEQRVPTTAITASYAGAGATAALLGEVLQDACRPSGAVRRFFDTVDPRGSSVAFIERVASCSECPGGHPLARIDCGPTVGELSSGWSRGADSDLALSNPVVLWSVCKGCGERRDFCTAAADTDISILDCTRCGPGTVRVEMRDQLSPDEMARLPRSMRLPVKYATYLRPEGMVLLEISYP